MEKFIIIVGSPNTGKTTSIHLLIRELIKRGYVEKETKLNYGTNINFWETKKGGSVYLEHNGEKILIVSYGDVVDKNLKDILSKEKIEKINCVICCSPATRGKYVHGYFHNFISKLDLNKVKVFPIYKNFLSGYEKEELENQQTVNLILKLIDLV